MKALYKYSSDYVGCKVYRGMALPDPLYINWRGEYIGYYPVTENKKNNNKIFKLLMGNGADSRTEEREDRYNIVQCQYKRKKEQITTDSAHLENNQGENMPIQISWNLYHQKHENFHIQIRFFSFIILLKT